MTRIKPNSTNITIVTLTAATLSLVACSLVATSIRADPRSSKSYHLILVQSLMRADIGLSFCVILYSSVQFHLGGYDLEQFCKSYLFLLVYFFLVSAGWTVMLALRFRSAQYVSSSANKPPVPLWAVWGLSCIPAAVVLISSWALPGVTKVRLDSSRTNQSCTFDHSTNGGIAVDLIAYQAPLIGILLVNLYTYAKGLQALRNAPHSVIARQMKKAGGYLFVLIVVWIPVIAYNLLVIFDDSKEPYDNFLDATVIMQAVQGFLNCTVYVYSNPTMRNWFINNFVFLKFIRHDRYDSRSTGAMSRNSTMQADRVDSPYATGRTSNATAAAATSLESGVIGVGVSGLGGDAVSAVSNTGINNAAGADAMGRQTNYPSSEYDSDDDTLWLADALSFSEMPKNIPQEVRDSVSAGFNFTNSIVGSSSLTRGNSITGGYGRRASTASNSGGGGGGNSTNGMNGNSGNSSSSGAHAHESAFRPYTDPVMNAIMQQAADAGTGNGGGGGGGGSSAVGTGSGSGKQGGLFLGTKQRNDSVGSSAASSTHSTRSILIAESSNKAIDAKNKRGSRFYPDIDSEKFVRFGGTETRVLSTGGNTPRGSEQSESALAEAERESNNIL